MKHWKHCVFVLLSTAFLLPGIAVAWEPDRNDKMQLKAAAEVERILRKSPELQKYFDEAVGYAIYPTMGRIGAGFGFAYGKGLVVEDDVPIGTSSNWLASIGFEFGFQFHSQILFFQDTLIFDELKSGTWEFQGRASIVLVATGAAGNPGYKPEVAIFSRTKGGLMVEVAAGAGKLSFKPYN
jgi:lipid-binding SYLF domain-containing protein